MQIEESSGDMLRRMGTDAEVWTREFHAVLKRTNPVVAQCLSPEPGDLLHGWFCNAIGAGESKGYAEGLKAGTVTQRVRFRLWVWTDRPRVWQKRKRENAAMGLAARLPGWLKRWVLVTTANEAIRRREGNPDRRLGYWGPDGVTFGDLYDATEPVTAADNSIAETTPA